MHIDWINGSARIKIQQEIRIVTGGNTRYKNERLVFFTMAALTMDFCGSDIRVGVGVGRIIQYLDSGLNCTLNSLFHWFYCVLICCFQRRYNLNGAGLVT